MIKHWTEGELKAELSKLTIIVDSKEKVYDHIEAYLKKNKVPYKVRHLETGDYSAQIDDMTLENDVVIERKASIDEVLMNLASTDRLRFERELIRAKAHGIKVFWLVENATWSDIFLGNYRSQASKKSVIASIITMIARYNLTLMFCKPEETPRLIWGIMYYYAREELLYGKY